MSKQQERERVRIKKKQQKSRSYWLIGAGVALIVIVGVWFVFSNQGSVNPPAQPISKLSTADFHSLAFSLTEPETVFFGHHNGLLMSQNGGKDWESTALKNADAMALALPLSDPRIMYAAGHDVFFKSNDGGETWNPVSTDLPGTDIHGFTVDPENANHVYAHVVGFGIFGSEDGGNTWTQLSSAVP
ncbi:MAG: YCF48-related protein, partial [Anaerolineae bacterium]|nr:YCF48-related protein [Anaerolineae bacterium]